MKLSDGEKLIVLMLCDLHKALQVKGAVDAEAVRAAVVGGNPGELARQLGGARDKEDGTDTVVQEVSDILNMWSAIERGYKRLSLEEKLEVEVGAGPLGRGVRFSGFDGETERGHRDVAHFFIEKTGRFDRFQGRNLEARMPTLKGYRRMLGVFAPMQPSAGEARLSAKQIIDLANAEKYAG